MVSFQILTFSLRGVGESKQKNFKSERFAMIFLTPPPNHHLNIFSLGELLSFNEGVSYSRVDPPVAS